jgi:hypothetical protein
MTRSKDAKCQRIGGAVIGTKTESSNCESRVRKLCTENKLILTIRS